MSNNSTTSQIHRFGQKVRKTIKVVKPYLELTGILLEIAIAAKVLGWW